MDDPGYKLGLDNTAPLTVLVYMPVPYLEPISIVDAKNSHEIWPFEPIYTPCAISKNLPPAIF